MIRRILASASVVILLAGVAFSQRGSELAAVPAVVAPDKLPEFDVADIQLSKETGQPPRARFLPGGRVEFHTIPMKFMVLAAWGYENDEGRVEGGPSWVNSETFDIVAKAPHDADIVTLRLMLRALLIKRFGLEVQIQDKLLPVYALTKGKGELKIKQSAKEAVVVCQRGSEDGVLQTDCHNMTMDELANSLRGFAPAYIDKPVVNLTELKGQYDFKFGWTPRGQLMGNPGGRGGAYDVNGGVSTAMKMTAGGMTVFEAVDKRLGLKLEPSKHSIPIIVIDKINRTATPN